LQADSDSGVRPIYPSDRKYSDNCRSRLLDRIRTKIGIGPAQLISAAYTNASWKAYESAWNSFKCFEKQTSCNFEWPLNQDALNKYITWACIERKLKSSTVETYIASLSSIHKLCGYSADCCSSFVTKTLLRGSEHLGPTILTPTHTRKVFTLPLLKLMGNEIAQTDWPEDSKRVFWTCTCLAFFGCFRIGELLAKHEDTYDPYSTLLWGNVKIENDSCLIHVKSPKSNNKEGDFIDLFKFPGHGCCPVSCIKALSKSKKCNKDVPVFRFDSGKLLTQENFNKTLKFLLKPIVGSSASEYTSHSLRAAIPSALDKFPHLSSDEDVQSWGRWDSPCFKRYTRLQKNKKKEIFSRISEALIS